MRIPKLPKWVLTDKFPAFYDLESSTSIEQVAKIYGATNKMIEEFNTFTQEMSEAFTEFDKEATAEMNEFAVGLRQEFQDFIDVVNLKLTWMEQRMEELIEEKYADKINEINELMESVQNTVQAQNKTIETAIQTQNTTIANNKAELEQELQDHMTTVNAKILEQDTEIDEATQYMKENITVAAESVIQEMVNSGELTLGTQYNAEEESLTIALEQTGGA